jgi:hypothetical protein
VLSNVDGPVIARCTGYSSRPCASPLALRKVPDAGVVFGVSTLSLAKTPAVIYALDEEEAPPAALLYAPVRQERPRWCYGVMSTSECRFWRSPRIPVLDSAYAAQTTGRTPSVCSGPKER